MHVLEPPDLWQRYIDPAWKHAAPIGLTELRRDMRVKVKSHVVLRIGTVRPQRGDAAGPWSTAQDEAFSEAERRGWDAVSQLQAMDREGLDMAVLFPSRGLFVLGLDSPQIMGIDGLEADFAAAIARAYNDWLRAFCAHAPERMLGAGMVAPHDVASAVAETRRCVEQLGFKAIFLAPGCVNRRPWHDPYYDPLWAECERLGIPVTFHGGGQTHLKPDFSLEVLDKLVMWHTFGQPLGEGVPHDELVEDRSEEQTSELQSHHDLVCRLVLEKKKKTKRHRRQVKSNDCAQLAGSLGAKREANAPAAYCMYG